MKTLYILMPMLFLVGCQPKADSAEASVVSQIIEIDPYDYDAQTKEHTFEVLGVDWESEKVLFHHSFQKYFSVEKPLSERKDEFDDSIQVQPALCNTGEDEQTRKSLIVGIYDLKSDQLEKFVELYSSVQNKSECTPIAKIAAARKEFESYKERYKFEPVTKGETLYQPVVVQLDGEEYRFQAESKIAEEKDWKQYGYTQPEYDGHGITVLRILKNGKKFYERPHRDYYAMAAGTNISVPMAVRNSNKIIFVERMQHHTADQGIRDTIWYSFSPILKIR